MAIFCLDRDATIIRKATWILLGLHHYTCVDLFLTIFLESLWLREQKGRCMLHTINLSNFISELAYYDGKNTLPPSEIHWTAASTNGAAVPYGSRSTTSTRLRSSRWLYISELATKTQRQKHYGKSPKCTMHLLHWLQLVAVRHLKMFPETHFGKRSQAVWSRW